MQIPADIMRIANSDFNPRPAAPRPVDRELFRKAMRKISKSPYSRFAKFHSYLDQYRRWVAISHQQIKLLTCEHAAVPPQQIAERKAVMERIGYVQAELEFLAEETNRRVIAILEKWQTDPRAQERLLFTLYERNKIGYNSYRAGRDGRAIVEWAMDPVRVRVIVVNANGVPDTVYEYDYSEQVII